jgi:hypothetical protein
MSLSAEFITATIFAIVMVLLGLGAIWIVRWQTYFLLRHQGKCSPVPLLSTVAPPFCLCPYTNHYQRTIPSADRADRNPLSLGMALSSSRLPGLNVAVAPDLLEQLCSTRQRIDCPACPAARREMKLRKTLRLLAQESQHWWRRKQNQMGREQNTECEVTLNKFTSWIWSTSPKGGYGVGPVGLEDWLEILGWEVLVGKCWFYGYS